jgi:hypothetical protein
MEDEGDIAVVAAFRMATLKAKYPSREATAVQEENRLGTVGEGLLDRIPHGAGQDEFSAAGVLVFFFA